MPADASQVAALGASVRAGGQRVGAQFGAVIRKGAYDIERTAKVNAAVDTGTNRDSISTTITGDGRHTVMSAEVGPTTDYGGFQEQGTYKMEPQPYLGPAWDQHLPSIESAVSALGGQLLP